MPGFYATSPGEKGGTGPAARARVCSADTSPRCGLHLPGAFWPQDEKLRVTLSGMRRGPAAVLCALLLSAGCGVGPEENTAAAVGSAAPIEPGSPVPPELRHEPRRLIDSENALPVLLEAGDNVSLDFGDDALLEALGA